MDSWTKKLVVGGTALAALSGLIWYFLKSESSTEIEIEVTSFSEISQQAIEEAKIVPKGEKDFTFDEAYTLKVFYILSKYLYATLVKKSHTELSFKHRIQFLKDGPKDEDQMGYQKAYL